MLSVRSFLTSACLFALSLSVSHQAFADTYTQTGAFTTDNQVVEYNFTVPTMQTYTLYTTSYGGGMNLNGTTSLAGGFVPVLSLFSAVGNPIANAGASGSCMGSAVADGATGMCNDAYLQLALTAGTYTLALTEFPNVAIGTLADGFLFAGDPSATGSVCGVSGGKFLEADLAPCVQRNGNYALNVSSASPVPEPPTWALVLPIAGVLFFAGRQQLS